MDSEVHNNVESTFCKRGIRRVQVEGAAIGRRALPIKSQAHVCIGAWRASFKMRYPQLPYGRAWRERGK